MRILMLSKALVVGAYQRKAEAIAAQPEVELELVVPPLWVDDGVERRLERKHLRGYTLTETPIRRPGDFHLHHYPELPDILDRVGPDLLHIDEEPYNLATFLALRAARARGIRTIVFTWQNLNRRYPPPFRWMERYVHRHADGAIAGNADAAEVLRTKGYAGPVWILPQFGVDPTVFRPAGDDSRPRPSAFEHANEGIKTQGDTAEPADPRFEEDRDPTITLGYAGRLVASKGVDLLLEALAGIPVGDRLASGERPAVESGERVEEWRASERMRGGASGPPPWRLRIVGEGPERAALESRASALGIADRVHFEGWAGSDAMPAFYRSLDLLVLPSRSTRSWVEQFGRVLIEAMASGAVCVGSDSGEIPRVIGEAGAVFPEGDAGALRACLAGLMRDQGRRRELSSAGRRRVLDRFTMDRIAAETVEAYRRILRA